MERLWNRFVSMREGRLTKTVFNWDYKHDKGWCSEIKLIFDKSGLAELYASKSICDRSIKSVINNEYEKLSETAQTQWRNGLDTRSKTKLYRNIKSDYKIENYVTMHLLWHLRSFIAQLRTGALPLHIETGRYRHVKTEKRFLFYM